MFYPTGLLHHPNTLVLNLAWLAATRGTNSINREQLEKCDVTKLCRTILQFLQSQSSDPKKRFSLRLSAMFVHGVLLIWGKQVTYIQNDIMLLIKTRQNDSNRLAMLLNNQTAQDSFKTPTAAKKKRRATKKVTETPESLVEITERTVEQIVDQLGRQITGPDVVQTSPPIIITEPASRVSEQDPFPLIAIDEAEGLQQEAREPLPPKMAVEALVQRPAEPEVPLPTVQPEDTVVKPEPEHPIPEEIVIQEAPPVFPVELPLVTKTPRKRPSVESESTVTSKREYGKKTVYQKLQIKTSRNKFPSIVDEDWMYVENEFLLGFDSPLRKFIPTKEFWPDSDTEFRAVEATAEPRGTDISDVPSYSVRDSITPTRVSALSKGLSLADSHVRPVTSTPKRTASVDRTIIDEVPPAGHNGILASQAKRRRLAHFVRVEDVEPFKVPEPPLPMMLLEDLPPGAPEMPRERLPEKLSSPRPDFGMKWSAEIIEIINAHCSITPVDICTNLRKRVSRSNMAIIFATLLVLCQRQFVFLRTVPGSTELNMVEKA